MATFRKNNKERTSTLFNRYVWLVETILREGRITFEEINDKWNRSRLNYSGDGEPYARLQSNFPEEYISKLPSFWRQVAP